MTGFIARYCCFFSWKQMITTDLSCVFTHGDKYGTTIGFKLQQTVSIQRKLIKQHAIAEAMFQLKIGKRFRYAFRSSEDWASLRIFSGKQSHSARFTVEGDIQISAVSGIHRAAVSAGIMKNVAKMKKMFRKFCRRNNAGIRRFLEGTRGVIAPCAIIVFWAAGR